MFLLESHDVSHFSSQQIKVLTGNMVSIQKHSAVSHLEKRVCLCAAMSATCALSA